MRFDKNTTKLKHYSTISHVLHARSVGSCVWALCLSLRFVGFCLAFGFLHAIRIRRQFMGIVAVVVTVVVAVASSLVFCDYLFAIVVSGV